jgi:hypothetical protein
MRFLGPFGPTPPHCGAGAVRSNGSRHGVCSHIVPAARVHDYWQATAASLRRRTRTRRCRQLLLQQSSHWWWRCCYWRCDHGGTSLVRPATPRTSTVAADGQHRCVSPVVWTPCVVLPLRAAMGALGPHLSRILDGAVCTRSARSGFPRSLGNAPCRIRAARHRVVRGCCVRWPRGEPVPPVCVAHLLSLQQAKEGSCAKKPSGLLDTFLLVCGAGAARGASDAAAPDLLSAAAAAEGGCAFDAGCRQPSYTHGSS